MAAIYTHWRVSIEYKINGGSPYTEKWEMERMIIKKGEKIGRGF